MGNSTKPRKAHRPRGKLIDPVSWAVAGVHTMLHADRERVMAPVKDAMQAVRNGRANREDWNAISQAMNIAESLAIEQVGRNLTPDIQDSQAALKSFGLRLAAGASSTCYDAEVSAISHGVFVYEAQLKVCAQADLGRAVRRVKAWHASGAMQDIGKLYETMKTGSCAPIRAELGENT